MTKEKTCYLLELKTLSGFYSVCLSIIQKFLTRNGTWSRINFGGSWQPWLKWYWVAGYKWHICETVGCFCHINEKKSTGKEEDQRDEETEGSTERLQHLLSQDNRKSMLKWTKAPESRLAEIFHHIASHYIASHHIKLK